MTYLRADMNFWCSSATNWKSCPIPWLTHMDMIRNSPTRGCGIGDWLVFQHTYTHTHICRSNLSIPALLHIELLVVCIDSSLRTADAFPVVASLPPKNSVCEPERQNDFPWRKTFLANHSLALKIKELTRETSRRIVRNGYVFKSKLKGRRGFPFFSERRVYES